MATFATDPPEEERIGAESTLIEQDGYSLSSDPARLDVDAIHAFLTTTYWSPGVPREIVEPSRALVHGRE